MLRLLGLAAVAFAGGCFSPSFQPCQVACGSGGACPPGTSCEADNMCHASSAEPLCTQAGDATTPFDGPAAHADAPTTDAGPKGPPDAATSDGGAVDAGRPSSDAGPRQPAAPGEVIITEIMNNPCGPSGGPCTVPDAKGEWFELHNATSESLDLKGLVVQDKSNPPQAFVIGSSVVIPAGGDVVLGNNGDASTNGGVKIDYAYPASFVLANSADEIVLELPNGGTVIDQVQYTAQFPGGQGIAMSLNPTDYSATANDSAQSWCDASTSMSDGDLGSPGVMNPPCP